MQVLKEHFAHTPKSQLLANLGLVVRKPVFGVSEKVSLKPISTATETSKKIEMSLVASLDNGAFQTANNKGADQTARMHRLVLAFVVCKPPKTGFLVTRPDFEASDVLSL